MQPERCGRAAWDFARLRPAGGAPDAVGVVHLAGWAVVIVFLEFDNDDFDPL